MDCITYQDIVTHYGDTAAFDLLLSVEKLARINSEIVNDEEDNRFQKALAALNEINFAPHIVSSR